MLHINYTSQWRIAKKGIVTISQLNISLYDLTMTTIAGIVYIQMSKTSEAVKAVNSFNAKCIGSMARPMKVGFSSRQIEVDLSWIIFVLQF